MPHVILTAIGSDRPGLVDEVSEYAFSRGANIEDSRMVNLRGQFAIMVLLGGEEKTISRLRADLSQLSQQTSLHAEMHEAKPATASSASGAESMPYRLTGTALDQPGLVHRVSHLLRELHVNIESLETRLRPAPYTGAPMFDMELILLVPRTTSLSQLRQNLSKHCDELNVDWELEPHS
jgi:glycine cleavage system transcriptional repressor